MGGGFYDEHSRGTRAATKGYHTKSREEIFSSQMHESMNPRDVKLREARDSADHPESFPVLLNLDVTSSMGSVPHNLIKDGLPTLMTALHARGCIDAALCFTAITDHISNRTPLQIGQFESADEELDMWLERSYLEGGGGGNGGESYLLAMVFAAFVVQTDHWDKRGKPGILLTVGDEPPHLTLPTSAAVEIFGEQAREWWEGDSITAVQLHDLIKDRWVCIHINVEHSGGGGEYGVSDNRWNNLLSAERVHTVHSTHVVSKMVDEIILQMEAQNSLPSNVPQVRTEDALGELPDDMEPALVTAMADGWERTVASGVWRRNPNLVARSEHLMTIYADTDKAPDELFETVGGAPDNAAGDDSDATSTPSASTSDTPSEEIELM